MIRKLHVTVQCSQHTYIYNYIIFLYVPMYIIYTETDLETEKKEAWREMNVERGKTNKIY